MIARAGLSLGALFGGDFSDPTNERIIYLSAAGLALVGVLLLVGTVLWWRRGRQEHPVLAPLEVMGERAWARAATTDRRRRLDVVRLDGAGATTDEPVRAEPLDLEAMVRSEPQPFDDLREPEAVEASAQAGAEPERVVEDGALAADAELEAEGGAEDGAEGGAEDGAGPQSEAEPRHEADDGATASVEPEAEAAAEPEIQPEDEAAVGAVLDAAAESEPGLEPQPDEAESSTDIDATSFDAVAGDAASPSEPVV